MNALPESTTCYHVYGIKSAGDYSVFIDYVADALEGRENELLERLRDTGNTSLRHWQQSHPIGDSDIFEIECADTALAAQEAVAFWREYLHALGETIVEGEHVCDRLEHDGAVPSTA